VTVKIFGAGIAVDRPRDGDGPSLAGVGRDGDGQAAIAVVGRCRGDAVEGDFGDLAEVAALMVTWVPGEPVVGEKLVMLGGVPVSRPGTSVRQMPRPKLPT
jgi:hypothetical protein